MESPKDIMESKLAVKSQYFIIFFFVVLLGWQVISLVNLLFEYGDNAKCFDVRCYE